MTLMWRKSPSCQDAWPTEGPNHEALSNAEQIIQEWIETAQELGRTIPKPKGRLAYA